MNNPHPVAVASFAVSSIQRCDRWSISHRLQELNIACTCPADGTLRLEVNHAIDLLLVRSTVRQFTHSRQHHIDWLDRCWQLPALTHSQNP